MLRDPLTKKLGAQPSFVSSTLYFAPTDELWLRLLEHYLRDED